MKIPRIFSPKISRKLHEDFRKNLPQISRIFHASDSFTPQILSHHLLFLTTESFAPLIPPHHWSFAPMILYHHIFHTKKFQEISRKVSRKFSPENLQKMTRRFSQNISSIFPEDLPKFLRENFPNTVKIHVPYLRDRASIPLVLQSRGAPENLTKKKWSVKILRREGGPMKILQRVFFSFVRFFIFRTVFLVQIRAWATQIVKISRLRRALFKFTYFDIGVKKSGVKELVRKIRWCERFS